MTTFNLNDSFVQVFNDLFSYIDLKHKFMCEVPESSLNSTEEVSTLVGVSGDMEGNIMFGYTSKTAKEIASKLMGVDTLAEIDVFAKAALVDFYASFCKKLIHTIKVENLFKPGGATKDYAMLSTNPTYIAGSNMNGLISRVASKKLFFKVNGEKFGIAYSLEQK